MQRARDNNSEAVPRWLALGGEAQDLQRKRSEAKTFAFRKKRYLYTPMFKSEYINKGGFVWGKKTQVDEKTKNDKGQHSDSKGPAAQQSRLLIVRPAGKEDRRIKAAGADPGPGRSRRARLPRGSFPPFPLNPPPADGVRALSGRKNSRRVNTGRERRDKSKIFFGFGFALCFLCVPAYLPRRHR